MLPCKPCTKWEVSTKDFIVPVYWYNDNKGFLFYTHTVSLPSRPLGEEDILIDPSELLGRRLDFQLVLEQMCGLRWIKACRDRGVQVG